MGLNIVIGAGWLGLPLAKSFESENVSTLITNRRNLSEPEHYPITKALQLDLEHRLDHPQTLQFLELLSGVEIDTIIGCFPPGFRRKEPAIFVDNWRKVSDMARQLSAKKIVMISTTGVYPSLEGLVYEDDISLDKVSDTRALNQNTLALLQAENVVKNSGIAYVIARLSGLVGPQRHPARFLNMMKQVSSSAPANMLHQRDAIAAIMFLAKNINNQTVNVTTPNTTSKLKFYSHANDHYGESFSMPDIVASADKQVSSEKLLRMGFNFHYNHVLEFFNDQNL